MATKLTEKQWNARREAALAVELPDSGMLTVELDGVVAKLPVVLRTFGTGSRGFYAGERINTEHGQFQANITITQVGSGAYKG